MFSLCKTENQKNTIVTKRIYERSNLGVLLTLNSRTFLSCFYHTLKIVCKVLKIVSKIFYLCIKSWLTLGNIQWLTLFTKYFLKILQNQQLKNTFFQGGVKIHPPSGNKGLKRPILAEPLSSIWLVRRRSRRTKSWNSL